MERKATGLGKNKLEEVQSLFKLHMKLVAGSSEESLKAEGSTSDPTFRKSYR